ncbi:winged helix-turn-helix transcriptional regulator [Tepidibacter thalassicus]|uniref:Winged helix-turn-helix DNA-binding n=1 Tax=Tepidibacter thalassicus DSM 15285 TaxID=1123350 RepID=A0A1M5SWF2_9FIRM|nr:winged helix-turn-helix transcriptional regulator [Tepidibacter thalassicus]SHH42341.1 Winged helix-turn-helix DNA-binding [Tepidibacter thalassicus DSM 15285]SHH42393.1 Winged helix-turn-helix DNA-binding [Tepidibacter thalassicus DSM 15285]
MRRQREYDEKRKEERKKARRNEQGLTKREQKKKEKINIIKKLIEENPKIKQREIAEKLGISQQMVSKYKKELED